MTPALIEKLNSERYARTLEVEELRELRAALDALRWRRFADDQPEFGVDVLVRAYDTEGSHRYALIECQDGGLRWDDGDWHSYRPHPQDLWLPIPAVCPIASSADNMREERLTVDASPDPANV